MPVEQVWGLLVDGSFEPGPPAGRAAPADVRSGDPRVDVQSALAMLAPEWGFRQLIDITDEQARDDLARASVMALSFVAQSARGVGRPPVPQRDVDPATTIPERFLIRWRGEADPDHVKAIDAYWISAAEHGMNASTFTARVVASTGADCAAALSSAVGALSGPLHGGAPSRVLKMLDEVERARRRRALGQATRWTAASGSWASATASTAPRTRGRGCCAARPASSARRASRSPRRSSAAALAELRRASPTASWPRTSSSGRPSCSTWPRCRRRSSRACSPARGSRAGRRTSSSRSARPGSSGRRRSTSARRPERPPSWGTRRTTSLVSGVSERGYGSRGGEVLAGRHPRHPPDPGGTRACAYFGCHACDGRVRRARPGGIRGDAAVGEGPLRPGRPGRPHRLRPVHRRCIDRHGHCEREEARRLVERHPTGSVARAAVDRYAGLLGVSNAGTQLRYAQATTDGLGQRHVRFDQLAGSVPVYDGAVTVHLARSDALTGFTAGVSRATSGRLAGIGQRGPGARRRPGPGPRRQARVRRRSSTSTRACRSAATRPRWPGPSM